MDIKVGLSNIAVMLCTAISESETSYKDLAKKVIYQLAELCLPDKQAGLITVLESSTNPVSALDIELASTLNQKIIESIQKFIEEIESVEEQLKSEVLVDEKILDELLKRPSPLLQLNNDSIIHIQMMKQRQEKNELLVKKLEQNLLQNKEKQNKLISLKSEAPKDVYKLLSERLSIIVLQDQINEKCESTLSLQAKEVKVSSLSSNNMRMSESDMTGSQDLVWPVNPSFQNPIQYIQSTSPESLYSYFNFTLQSGERSNLIEEYEKCEKRSKKIERVKRAIIYYTQIDSTLMGIKLIGEANEKICTMGLCDGDTASIETKEISLKDKERLVGFASHTHGNALHFGFRFIIASSDC